MFGGVIWDKLLKCIFENFEIPQIKLQKKRRKKTKFSKITTVIFRKNHSNQTCCFWLIKLNQENLCNKTNIFLTVGSYKSASPNYKITPLTVQY